MTRARVRSTQGWLALLATIVVTALLLVPAVVSSAYAATGPSPALTAQPLTTGSRAGDAPTWTVALDQQQLSSSLGNRFTFVSTLDNLTDQVRPGTIAYLNVVSMRSDVYVDPEDWSSHRTRFLGDVQPGATTRLTWNVQAVNSGSFVVFVVVTSATGSDEVVTSPALRVMIADQRRLNPTGILPVVVAVPAVVALGLVWSWRRRRALR